MQRRVTLREVCDTVEYGYTASSDSQQIGPKFLRITDIVPDLIDWNAVPYCPIEPSKLEKYRLKTGDIVIARTGATTGWAKYIQDPPEAVFASYLIRIQPSADVDARFIGFLVESAGYKEFIQRHMGGAAQPNANAQILTSFDFDLPDLPTQRRIAGILSAYDELIANNQRRIAALEQMARALYREWFVYFRAPGAVMGGGELPEGWEVKRLDEITDSVRSSVAKGELDEEVPYLGLEHIPRRSLALDAWEYSRDLGSSKLLFKKGDVLFGKIRPYFHKVSVAPFDGLCSSDTIVIRAKTDRYHALATCCASSDEFVAHATATSNGSKMPRADWKVLRDYPVAVPPEELLSKFSAFVDNAIEQMQTLIFQTANLRRTRDLLLPRLMNGRVEVNTIEA